MRTHQRQYAIAETFILDELCYLLNFRLAQVHRTVWRNAIRFSVFGALFDFIDIVIGIDYIDINGDGHSLKKFGPSLSYQPLVEVVLIGDVRVNLPRLKSRASIQFI